jgi:hypothetical protein
VERHEIEGSHGPGGQDELGRRLEREASQKLLRLSSPERRRRHRAQAKEEAERGGGGGGVGEERAVAYPVSPRRSEREVQAWVERQAADEQQRGSRLAAQVGQSGWLLSRRGL